MEHQLRQLFEWAKRIPHFVELHRLDQVALLRAGWNELIIASLSYRSVQYPNTIRLGNDLNVGMELASSVGMDPIFERVLVELVTKMRDMKMDLVELGCLRTIVLFNPGEARTAAAGGDPHSTIRAPKPPQTNNNHLTITLA